jgi:hypothetical protein
VTGFPTGVIRLVAVAVMLIAGGCVSAPTAQRSGLDSAAGTPMIADDNRWGQVSNEPALETARVEGVVVVVSTDELITPVSGRVVAAPRRAGVSVEAGESVVTILPTDQAVEALQDTAVALEAAIAADATGDELADLLAARAAAAARVGQQGTSASPESVQVLAAVDGVVVGNPPQPGDFVEAGTAVLAIGATSQLEVHATIPVDFFESFAAERPVTVVGRQSGAGPVGAELADAPNRIIERLDDEEAAVYRLRFTETPSLSDGDRVSVETAMMNDVGLLSIPIRGLRVFGQQSFALVERRSGVERVDVQVVRTGPDRIEVRPTVADTLVEGDRVWLR